MTHQQQADLLSKVCERVGLDSSIRLIKSKREVNTWAEQIAVRLKGSSPMSVKSSYLYCDTLDATFFYDDYDTPVVAYAGYATVNSKDLSEGKLINAFNKAKEVLDVMEELVKEERVGTG